VRLVENARDLQAVEARIAHDLGLDQIVFLDLRVQRVGQTRAAGGAEVDRVHVVRRGVRAHQQREPRFVAREANLREIAGRQVRQRDFLA
jgi:hypothetical protein